MPVNDARQANLLDKGALGALETPTRRCRGSFTGSAVVRQEGESANTPCKTDVINCICGKNRESAAKDKRDWVCCEGCTCWSHPTCYRVAQVVVAKDDVHFLCFFCSTNILMRWQALLDRVEVSCKATAEVQESLSSLQEEMAVRIDELTQRTEERCVEIRTLIGKLESTSTEMKKQGTFVGKDSEVEMVLTAGTLNSAEGKRRKKGIRKLWGTGRLINVNQVQKEIGVCIGTDKARGVKVERLFKRRNGKYIWWFELNSSEKLLVEVESLWHHDYWRLERLKSWFGAT